jgi:hypothetical protein
MENISRDNYRITDYRPLGSGRIELRFINGVWVRVDFSSLIARGGSFARLGDDTYLAQGRIGDYGHWMEWPDELDFGADQLWWWGLPVAAPVEPAIR